MLFNKSLATFGRYLMLMGRTPRKDADVFQTIH